jgi:hypothetical protein
MSDCERAIDYGEPIHVEDVSACSPIVESHVDVVQERLSYSVRSSIAVVVIGLERGAECIGVTGAPDAVGNGP